MFESLLRTLAAHSALNEWLCVVNEAVEKFAGKEGEKRSAPRLKLQKHLILPPAFNPELEILRLSQLNLERGRAALAPFQPANFRRTRSLMSIESQLPFSAFHN